MSTNQSVTIMSIVKAANILNIFIKNNNIGISEIASFMGMSKSTVYGIVNTLVEVGFLEQDSDTKKYRLGLKLFELGCAVEGRMDLRTEAKQFCEELTKKYSCTVHIATYSESDVVYIDKFDVSDFLIVYSQVGHRAPMNLTGVGKAMLAYIGDEYIEKYVIKNLSSRTPNSCNTPDKLYRDLEKVRQNGYAIDNEEIQQGLKCVAAPIFSKGGIVVGAVSLSGMASGMSDEKMACMAKDIVLCANNISKRLGFIKK